MCGLYYSVERDVTLCSCHTTWLLHSTCLALHLAKWLRHTLAWSRHATGLSHGTFMSHYDTFTLLNLFTSYRLCADYIANLLKSHLATALFTSNFVHLILRYSKRHIQWKLDLAKCQGTREIDLSYRGFVVSRPGGRISFVIPRTFIHVTPPVLRHAAPRHVFITPLYLQAMFYTSHRDMFA